MGKYVIYTLCLLLLSGCSGGKSPSTSAAERLVEEYYDAVVDQDADELRNFFAPQTRDLCTSDVLQDVLSQLRFDKPLTIGEVQSASEAKVTLLASGPWGDNEPFVVQLSADRRFLQSDPLALKCLDRKEELIKEEITTAAEEFQQIQEGFRPKSLEECRSRAYTFQECAQFGLAAPSQYTGPYSYSGDAKTITEDFCVTADKLIIQYTSVGAGQFPDIYHLSFILRDEFDNFVDSVTGLKGDGTFNLKTEGPGCYFLEVEPFDASWSVTIGQ